MSKIFIKENYTSNSNNYEFDYMIANTFDLGGTRLEMAIIRPLWTANQLVVGFIPWMAQTGLVYVLNSLINCIPKEDYNNFIKTLTDPDFENSNHKTLSVVLSYWAGGDAGFAWDVKKKCWVFDMGFPNSPRNANTSFTLNYHEVIILFYNNFKTQHKLIRQYLTPTEKEVVIQSGWFQEFEEWLVELEKLYSQITNK
ncbi:MAG: hypothetical protein OHK0017_13900 [Patescibacteria group bacterium]